MCKKSPALAALLAITLGLAAAVSAQEKTETYEAVVALGMSKSPFRISVTRRKNPPGPVLIVKMQRTPN